MELQLEKLKALLGKTSSDNDVQLQFLLDNIKEVILNYCNLDELPAGLANTAYRMAIDAYKAEGIGNSNGAENPVSSISEGDTSVSFAVLSMDASYTASLMKNYTPQLNRYRRTVKKC